MATCKNCGKKGLFLKLNVRGLCSECAELARSRVPSGQIRFGIGEQTNNEDVVKIGHSEEEAACNFFIDELVKRGKSKEKFRIEHRSQEYTSLFYELSDFLRVKITDNVKWITICLSPEDREKYKDCELFEEQKNKNEAHWKSYFNSIDDLARYVDIAANAPAAEVYGFTRELTEKEQSIADYLVKLFVECGAESEDFYLYNLTNEFELMYHSQFGNIRVKAFAKKPGGYVVDGRFDEYGFKLEKNRLQFEELADLDILKEKYIPEKIKKGLDDKYSSDMKYYIKYK